MAKKLLLVDLDGTLAKQEEGQPFTEIGEPLPNARKAMILLSKHFKLTCFTVRPPDLAASWLRRWGFPEMEVTAVKRSGLLIDDKAINFPGIWTDELITKLKFFKPHWQTHDEADSN